MGCIGKCSSPSLKLLSGSVLTCLSSLSRSVSFAYHCLLLPEGICYSKFVLQYSFVIENVVRSHTCLVLARIALTVDEMVACQYIVG